MSTPSWNKVSEKKIKAQPEKGIWQLAYDYIEGPALLKIEATGEWNYSVNYAGTCSANGELASVIDPKRCIHESSPVGALIAKIGGSTADRTASVFTVGELCVRKVDNDTSGPLFLTINDVWDGLGDNEGELTVTISIGKQGQAPSSTPSTA